jgi:hypothetical protein
MPRTLAATAAALGLTLAVPALADPPQVAGLSPLGIRRGVATEVTISGANLAGKPPTLGAADDRRRARGGPQRRRRPR